jgi:pimeloyl-ACP methyl ester carboxylesterase
MNVERGFLRLREGQMHYRTTGSVGGVHGRVLWMIHASPSSSVQLVPLMQALADGRRIIAPDTLGNGDSARPDVAEPDAAYYADATLRAMDAFGVREVDLFGSHTGAHIATEVALAAPQRVRRLVLDGIGMFDAATRARLLANYAPAVKPDVFGAQIHWAWHFVRDQAWFFPYFERDARHNRGRGLPSAGVLHATTVEVLKAIETYHLGYRAAFSHPDRERLPLLRVPTLVIADETDPLKSGVDAAADLIPGAQRDILAGESTAQGLAAKAARISAFLDG